MQDFRLLYFRESMLETAEEITTRDLLEAVEKGAGQPPDIRVVVGASPGGHHWAVAARMEMKSGPAREAKARVLA